MRLSNNSKIYHGLLCREQEEIPKEEEIPKGEEIRLLIGEHLKVGQPDVTGRTEVR